MIAISAGHYPERPGACAGDFCEHGEAKRWAIRLVEILGVDRSVMVPPGTLVSKVSWINNIRPTFAVEIHFNGNIPKAVGSETLFYPGSIRGQLLAEAVQSNVSRIFSPNRGIKHGWYRLDAPGVVDYPGDIDGDEKLDYFLAKTWCPAIIVEPEFICNQTKIQDNREAGCNAIAEGLLEALKQLT